MSRKFSTAALGVMTLTLFGAFGAYAPASATWATAIPAEPEATLLPLSVVEEANLEGETPAFPLPDMNDVDLGRASSLAGLVSRHGGTSAANREAECLAIAVYFESKGEPLDGQLAVAKTVINRTNSGRFPSSICSVVYQPSQFSFIRGGVHPAIARSGNHWKTAVAIGHIAQNDLWDSSISNALFFHARRVSPGWKMRRVAAVGNHVFYR